MQPLPSVSKSTVIVCSHRFVLNRSATISRPSPPRCRRTNTPLLQCALGVWPHVRTLAQVGARAGCIRIDLRAGLNVLLDAEFISGDAPVITVLYCPRVLGQWFDGIRFYAAASSPRRSRRTWAGLR